MSQATYQTLTEIMSQPSAWQGALAELDRQQAPLKAFLEQHQPDELLYVGCGSPYFLARSAASLSCAITRRNSKAHPGSDMWLFTEQTLNPGSKNALVVISRSGETSEVLNAIGSYRAQGGKAVAAITCYDSSLSQTADFTLFAREAQEIGLAQTRSFTSMLILTQGFIHTLAGKPLSAAFRTLPEKGQRLLDQYSDFAQTFGSEMSQKFGRTFFLGGGANYGIACEVMLKMKEMSLTLSEAYHFMEFRHGPMSMANPETLIVGLVSEAAFDYEAAVLAEMRQKGATVLAITPRTLPTESADHQVILPEGLTDLERLPLYLPVLHRMIYAHTVRKGLNPDLPNNLTAVINLDGVHNAPRT